MGVKDGGVRLHREESVITIYALLTARSVPLTGLHERKKGCTRPYHLATNKKVVWCNRVVWEVRREH